jgi:creatinine amidohydrolase
MIRNMNKTISTISDLAWPEVQSRLDQGCKIAVLPFGHTEQHGPHLPLGTDTLFISAVTALGAGRAMRESGKPVALVFPTLPFGNGGKFANGELRLRPSTFVAVFKDLIQEVEAQGFTKVVIASGHGSNEPIMGSVLNEAYWSGSQVDGYTVSPYIFIDDTIKDILESDDYGHACEVETSIALCLFPDRVQMDKIPNDNEQPEFWSKAKQWRPRRNKWSATSGRTPVR